MIKIYKEIINNINIFLIRNLNAEKYVLTISVFQCIKDLVNLGNDYFYFN